MIFLGLVLKNNNFMLLNLYNYVIINKQWVARASVNPIVLAILFYGIKEVNYE